MTQVPSRLRAGSAIVALGLVVAALVMACSGSATPSPSAAGPSSGAAGGAAELNGRWVLTSYTSPDGTQANVPAAVLPDITFAGNAAQGNAGCNTFNAIAVINGNQIHFDQVQSTKVACPPPASTIEAAYLQALNLSSEWKVEGDTLTISAAGNKPPSLVFARAGS